jgi:proteasome lid subunit RPN8/RPN11
MKTDAQTPAMSSSVTTRMTAMSASIATTPIVNSTPNLKRRITKMITVKIDPRVLEKIRHWTAIARGEFSALGLVQKNGDDLIVPEILLPKQTCDSSSTEMDSEDVARLLIDMERQGRDSQSLRLWLHSHGEMKCFWSNTDNDTIEEMANDSFVLSIVVNKAGDSKCRVDVFRPFRHTFNDLRVEPLLPDFNLFEECKAQIAEKVKRGNGFVSPGKPKKSALFDGFDEELVFESEYAELERRFQHGEITMQEYMAQLDGIGSFV